MPLPRFLLHSLSRAGALLCHRKRAVTINKYLVKAIAVDTYLNDRGGTGGAQACHQEIERKRERERERERGGLRLNRLGTFGTSVGGVRVIAHKSSLRLGRYF